MASFAVTDIIRASRDRIWSAWLDIDHWPQWMPTVTAVTHLDSGLLQLGHEARLYQPRLRPAIWKVIQLDESAGIFIWESRSPGIVSTGFHHAEPVDGGTRVTLAVEFSGLLAPFVRLFYGKLTLKYIAAEMAGLKVYCEF
jgi:hypothetical protein